MESLKKEQYDIPVMIIRGGTSKGIYILEEDMPKDKEKWEPILLRMMGSPDKKQIDGIGGAQSVTSKVAIIAKSKRSDADVDYTFAQVSVDKPLVSYKGNCGNISSGVGPYAIEMGLVEAKEGNTTVRIYNTNTDKIIEANVETKDGEVVYEGDFAIAGVPGTSSPIKLKFLNPTGTLGKGLLPTGNVVDTVELKQDDGSVSKVRVSIVDAANPLAFIRAEEVGLVGNETVEDIDSNPNLLKMLEDIRGLAAVKLGIIDDYTKSAWETPGIPKLTIVSSPKDYVTSSGKEIKAGDIDLLSKMMSMQKAHPSYAMTGAMCTAAASIVKGSIVNEVLREGFDTQFIRIGHPSGTLECGVNYTEENGLDIFDTFGFRTANYLMKGVVRIKI